MTAEALALATALFGESRRATCLVVDRDTIVGQCTVSREFSTWQAADYAHMDTLFVEETHRGRRIGERLVRAAAQAALDLGAAEMQWQTPAWNTDAIRFYDRLGTAGSPKVRFALALPFKLGQNIDL